MCTLVRNYGVFQSRERNLLNRKSVNPALRVIEGRVDVDTLLNGELDYLGFNQYLNLFNSKTFIINE